MVARKQSQRDRAAIQDQYKEERAGTHFNSADARRELEKLLRIDESALEQAEAEQGEVYYRVAKASALATSRRDAAAQALKDEEAQASLSIRESYSAEQKVTEKTIEAEVRLDKRVAAQRSRYLELQAEAALWEALLEAFNKRSYALRDLVQMHLKEFATASGLLSEQLVEQIRQKRHEARREAGYTRPRSRNEDKE